MWCSPARSRLRAGVRACESRSDTSVALGGCEMVMQIGSSSMVEGKQVWQIEDWCV